MRLKASVHSSWRRKIMNRKPTFRVRAFFDSVIYRAKMLGKMVGVEYAEG